MGEKRKKAPRRAVDVKQGGRAEVTCLAISDERTRRRAGRCSNTMPQNRSSSIFSRVVQLGRCTVHPECSTIGRGGRRDDKKTNGRVVQRRGEWKRYC